MRILRTNKIHQIYYMILIILSNMLYNTYPLITNNKQSIIRKLSASSYWLKKNDNYILSLQSSIIPMSSKNPITSLPSDDIEWILQFDGGSKGNPGRGGAGAVIFTRNKKSGELKEIWYKYQFLGSTGITNNFAEYKGLTEGLKQVIKMKIPSVQIEGDSLLIINQVQGIFNNKIYRYIILGDSLLIINQVQGIFKVRDENLKLCHIKVNKFLPKIKEIVFIHIPRELNNRADALSNVAIFSGKTKSKMNYDNLNELQIVMQTTNSKSLRTSNNKINNNDDNNDSNNDSNNKEKTEINKKITSSKKVPKLKVSKNHSLIDDNVLINSSSITSSSGNSSDTSTILNNKIRSVSNLKKSKDKRTLTTTTRNNRFNNTNSNMNTATHKLIIIPVYQDKSLIDQELSKKKKKLKNELENKSNLSKQQILSNIITNGYGIIAERFRIIDQPSSNIDQPISDIDNNNHNNIIPTLEFLSYDLQASTFSTSLAKLFFNNDSYFNAQNAHVNITDSYLFDYLNQNKLNGKIIKRDTIWSPSIKSIHSMVNYDDINEIHTINNNSDGIIKEEITINHNISNIIVENHALKDDEISINCIEEYFISENIYNTNTTDTAYNANTTTTINIANNATNTNANTNQLEDISLVINDETITSSSVVVVNDDNYSIDSNEINNHTMNRTDQDSIDYVSFTNIINNDSIHTSNINITNISNTTYNTNDMINTTNNNEIIVDSNSNTGLTFINHENNHNSILTRNHYSQHQEFSYLENHYSLTSSITVYLIELENKESLMKTIKKINEKATTNFIKNIKSLQNKNNLNKNGKFTKNLIQQGLIQLLPLKINNLIPYLQNESYYNSKSVDSFLFSWALGSNLYSNINTDSNIDIIEASFFT